MLEDLKGFVCNVVDVFTPIQIVRDGTTQVLARRFMGQDVTMECVVPFYWISLFANR
jgi:hypothetical protein